MTLFSTAQTHNVNQKCDVAQEVLETFHQIDPQYLRTISTPLVYHLGGIGHILASVMEGLLCEDSYQRVRGLLVSMADLLQGLESGLQPTAGASRDLRKQIDKIDQYMDVQRQLVHNISIQGRQQQNHTPTNAGLQAGLMQQSQPPIMNALGMQTPLDEFQLPSDLVSTSAWPWPFEFTPHMEQQPIQPWAQGYE